MESPIATVIAAAQTAHDAGVTVLLNDSPFMDELPHELVEATDILLVNQHEVAQLLGLPDDDVESLDWYEVAERFTDYGFDRAIVTLGASGIGGDRERTLASRIRRASQCSGHHRLRRLVHGDRAGWLGRRSYAAAIRANRSYVSAYAATKLVPKVPTVPPKKSSPTSADL